MHLERGPVILHLDQDDVELLLDCLQISYNASDYCSPQEALSKDLYKLLGGSEDEICSGKVVNYILEAISGPGDEPKPFPTRSGK